jgi:hypothetical protein
LPAAFGGWQSVLKESENGRLQPLRTKDSTMTQDAARSRLQGFVSSITYPWALGVFWWQLWLWRKVFCCRGLHLFDSVRTWDADRGMIDYLHCDACGALLDVLGPRDVNNGRSSLGDTPLHGPGSGDAT